MPNMISLKEFLEKKTLFFSEININTVKIAWDYISIFAKPKCTIHIIGTNGKGSTGRILAEYLHRKNYSVLHYTSPHILKFNERIWIDGKDVDDETLEINHIRLQKLLPQELIGNLSYFEYTTLLALLLSNDKDVLVLEAGLGGEFDATNVIKNDLTILTTVDYDHQDFLGNTIEEITSTKVRSMDTAVIVAKQIHDEVYEIARNIATSKHLQYFRFDDFDNSKKTYNIFEQKFLNDNLLSVISALEYLKIPLDIDTFKGINIQGRCQRIAPNITIDVGHNPLGAYVIYKEFEKKKVFLVYNTLKDKDYKRVLSILKPIIEHLYIIDIDDTRALGRDKLENVLNELDISYSSFTHIPEDKDILVFGSFKVVEEFLKFYEK
ncbi:MAG: Mur ligase family protein [Arcobacteraceae bacterium]|jgi:dihydrofolate synthase/folylpolyglutamate synthase|nr:Mur ligase family protein [Arcobacteraceae bacterium]